MAKLSVDQALLKAKAHAQKGEIEDAKNLYQIVLQAFPQNEQAQQGLATLNKPKLSAAAEIPPQEIINQLINLYNQEKFAEVVDQAQMLTEQYPKAFLIWNILGVSNKRLGQIKAASEAFKKVTELKPNDALGFNSFGVTLKEQGKLEEAIRSYAKALSLNPDYADAYNNMGNALNALGKLDEAIASYEKALSLKPDYTSAYYSMGNALKAQGKLEEAIASYEKALFFKPDYVDAYNNLGNALQDQSKFGDAIEVYKKAVSFKPNYLAAYVNIGNALREQGRLEEAIASYEQALSFNPCMEVAHNNLGVVFEEQGKLDEALASYEQALSSKPDYTIVQSQKLHLQAHICDWSSLDRDRSLIAGLGVLTEGVPPFRFLSFEDAPEQHRSRSVNYVRRKFSLERVVDFRKSEQVPKRLKVGYFSADFHNHATMYLMAQIFERHDKEQFDIYAYSYGPDKQDEMRKRLIENVDVFHDVREMSDMQIVEQARSEQLDIAIDLKGFTKGARLAPFAHGLASVQISYLGYPGTIGADFIDYIVADPVVIPEDKQHHYSEQIIYLPNTYQPTDNTRVISDKIITREDMGLPSNGFVFCCFNANYKISPTEFDIWMRLLGRVESSVLWLLKSNKWAEQNLKREAEARGISAERLVFAEKVPQAEHLARHKLADLFLDTFNVNAHTTASDALWAGLPVVTKLGEGFAARVAGSLLTAIGLPELITQSEEAYEALALALATDPKQLGEIKSKLDRNRLTQPLFDSQMYTRHLEAGYQMAYDRYFNELSAEVILV